MKISKGIRIKAIRRVLKRLEKEYKSYSPFSGSERPEQIYHEMDYLNDRYYELTGKYY